MLGIPRVSISGLYEFHKMEVRLFLDTLRSFEKKSYFQLLIIE